MKIEYVPNQDILNVEFLEGVEIDDSIEVDGIIFDYSKDKRIVSVEILDAKKRIGKSPLDKVDFSVMKDKVIVVWKTPIISSSRTQLAQTLSSHTL